MTSVAQPFSAIILAADRKQDDPVAQALNVSCKALAPVSGRAMVLRVLDALSEARQVGDRILVGPAICALEESAELNTSVRTGEVRWLPPQATPSSSALNALQSLPEEVPVLVTTADHALLTAKMVDYFCEMARSSDCDVIAGVARYELIAKAFPDAKRTVTKLKDGGYCGCNLFAFMTPQARLAAEFWRKVENERKQPLRVIKVLGWMTVLRYLMGTLTLQYALDSLSKRMRLKAGVVQMPFAEAAVDVDKVDDWHLVESVLAKR
jgi:GTP:adenosylcobinamide-phosphate guanylyltransferase